MYNEDKIELITPATYDQAVDRAIEKAANALTAYFPRLSDKGIEVTVISIAVAYRCLRDEIFGGVQND